jgi:hypothetical protein
MTTATLVRPSKQEQVAALMLLVFQANPNTVMTREDIESLVNVSEFSVSTRWRALNCLANRHLIHQDSRDEWGGPHPPTTYWMSDEEAKSA